MEVAPYSPRARAKASTVPARMPWRHTGIRTRQKIQILDRPRVAAASASVGSKLWRTDNDTEALRWVLVNIAISAVFLLAVNLLEARQKRAGKGGRR